MSFHAWLLMIVTCGVGSLIPGPNAILVLNHVTFYGISKTLSTIAGGAIGFTLMIAICLFGVGTIIVAEPVVLIVLKVLGGAYLVFLSHKLWIAPPIELKRGKWSLRDSRFKMFRNGFMAAVTNPKAMMLYSVVLPGFVDDKRNLCFQFMIMAGTLVFIECFVEFAFALVGSELKYCLQRSGRKFNRVCSMIFLVFALVIQITK